MNQNQFVASRSWPDIYQIEGTPVAESAGYRSCTANDGNETWRNVERCIAYMVAHVNKPLQVATLAAVANVSQSHFFTLFKQRTGHPPMDYFTRIRMNYACRLLDSTSASVKEVAAILGYDDPFYFSRVFKSINKLSPTSYRARDGGEKNDVKKIVLSDFVPAWLPRSMSGDHNNQPVQRTCQPGIQGRAGEYETPAKKVLLSIP